MSTPKPIILYLDCTCGVCHQPMSKGETAMWDGTGSPAVLTHLDCFGKTPQQEPPKDQTVKYTLRMPSKMAGVLQKKAQEQGISSAELIRQLITERLFEARGC